VSATLKFNQIEEEQRTARQCGWFSVRYFEPLTLSGDQTRYIFVNASKYGVVWGNVSFFIIMHIAFTYGMYVLLRNCERHALWVMCYGIGLFGGVGVTAGMACTSSYRAISSL
jgi:hypothetical protein